MANWKSRAQAWMFPAATQYDATAEISDGRFTYILKPQYFFVTTGAVGTLTQMNAGGTYPANGYSVANAALVKKYSTKQFVTVSCNDAGDMDAICGSGTNTTAVINQLISFLQANSFTGVDLDWENFTVSGCTTTQYAHFLTFSSALATAFHAVGLQTMVTFSAINNLNGVPFSDGESNQASYRFKYEDMVPYFDFIVMQGYDEMFGYGAGTSISPNAFLTANCAWLLSKVPVAQAVMGLPAYGYYGSDTSFNFHEDNYNAFSGYLGFGTATRNADSEMNWQQTPAINATASIAMGATSATLASPWALPSSPPGGFTVTFSNGQTKGANVTKNSTSITWSGGLTSGSTSALTWTAIDFFYMDTSGMNSKRTLVETAGIQHVSVWYVGGNQWFTGVEPSNPSFSNSNVTNLSSITNLTSITI